MQRIRLAPDHEISRVIRGGWQMAGGHGGVDSAAAVEDMIAFADAGITTFDCADIYTGVEELIGAFRARYRALRGAEALARIKVHTKCVPDLDLLPRLRRADVAGIVDRSLRRLGAERLDLVQFHWWDYAVPGWLEAAGLARRAAPRRARSATSAAPTSTPSTWRRSSTRACRSCRCRCSIRCSTAGRRRRCAPRRRRAGCRSSATAPSPGGFLGDRWLGKREPEGPLENRSLTKYKLVIDDIGGWDLFQALLATLRRVADRHGSDIATVASAAVLARPGVAAVIVGARNRAHLAANLAIADLALDAGDMAAIDAVLAEARPLAGDVYALERDRSGRHGAIMKYNLNEGAA